MADCHLALHLRTQETVQTSIHTFRAILLRAEKMLHHRTAGGTPVIMVILETVLHQTEETEIEGLVAGVRIASVVRGCKTESASYTTVAVEFTGDLWEYVIINDQNKAQNRRSDP